MTRNILFLTGTRADFGKLKPLIRAVEQTGGLDYGLFVTGMHLLTKHGHTIDEIRKSGFKNQYAFINQGAGEPMEMVLANTIQGLSRYVREHMPDLLVVHGDRVEALAGAIVGALANVLVAHIEGGELSGTVDELIRHAVSKMSHLHFVANGAAAERLQQLGELPESIHVIGSPDIDVMLSSDLPSLADTCGRYDIPFSSYALALFHPVTTDLQDQRRCAEQFAAALRESHRNWVVIHPNNDHGSDEILLAYRSLVGQPRFRFFPSVRFEHFITLLKHCEFIVGNSSAGIREAPVFAVPTINVGSRQNGRFEYASILNVPCQTEEILRAMAEAPSRRGTTPTHFFGDGRSAENFLNVLRNPKVWETAKQKQFRDVRFSTP
jgi:UDP-N-acetylglucosamine 2-epimerase (hydrolysing)